MCALRNLHDIIVENSLDTWIGKDGIEVPISSLATKHLINIMKKHALEYSDTTRWGKRVNGVRLEYMRRTHQL